MAEGSGSGPLTAYDVVAYPGHAYPQTHPTRLGAIAQLLGLAAAPAEQCRVLELACGDGANLIPMAIALPESRFVGVDLAASAIAAGRELIAELGLRNIELHAQDASALGSDFGQFDYVIAHGVYSWVPETVRDGLLATIQARLTNHGVGFVSFSAYPGAYFRQLARELMLFHTDPAEAPAARLGQGIDFLRFVRENHGSTTAYSATLDQELERITKAAPGYVLHDDFSENNDPVYFSAFAEHLAAHNLQYLADATFDFFFDRRLSGVVCDKIAKLSASNIVAEQQYLDMLRGTPFRQVLICHAEAEIDRHLDPKRFLSLQVNAWLAPTVPNPNVADESSVIFRTSDGTEVETSEPLAKALLAELAQTYPAPLRVQTLLDHALKRLGHEPRQEQDYAAHALGILKSTLLSGAATQLLSLWYGEQSGAQSAGERPLASPLARLQASRGESVTSLRHTTVRLTDAPARHLLVLMDGKRTRAQLLLALRERLLETTPGVPTTELNQEDLEATLEGLARHGFVLA